MELTITARGAGKKGENKGLRREGDIPAAIYSAGKQAETVVVKGAEFLALIRQAPEGRLGTTLLTLKEGSKERKAILKEIQYARTTYKIEHIDFQEVKGKGKIRVKVPIRLVGIVECSGVKQGGALRQVVRKVEVECNAENIPAEFVVDITNLDLGKSHRLSDLKTAPGVRLLALGNPAVVVISRRSGGTATATTAAAAT